MHQLTPNDKFMVLASDGVWEFLSNEEVFFVLRYRVCARYLTHYLAHYLAHGFTLFCSSFGIIFSVWDFLNEKEFSSVSRYRECAHYLTRHLALDT